MIERQAKYLRSTTSNAGNQCFLDHYTGDHFWRQLEALIDRPRAAS
jgi:hypothetical protein